MFFIIQGTPDHLMQHLVQEHSAVDPTYVEDFLLCFRVFIKDNMDLASKLQNWFETSSYRNKVCSKKVSSSILLIPETFRMNLGFLHSMLSRKFMLWHNLLFSVPSVKQEITTTWNWMTCAICILFEEAY